MQRRRVGHTSIELSVVGLGTAQLQMVPERQTVETLVRGFELGINWVHTAPDYGGIDPWIQKAVKQSGRAVHVLSSGPERNEDLEPFFENTCHVYQTPRLALYGLAGIEDLEWRGENVWGRGGMVEYLQTQKAKGRLGGIYCSTHGSADYVLRLIESRLFDAIMLAWNPLGFHQQSQLWARRKIGRDYEDLPEYRDRVFPLASERGVSLLIMKPFAGGLLCRSKALPPHDWYADGAEPLPAGDILRLILEQQAVCAVVPGSASAEEAEENARAGHAPLFVSEAGRARIRRAVTSMRTTLCSRCGACEPTCSQSINIPAMFRDAYIWTSRNETSMANATENYFDLHPRDTLTCATCVERTCSCPQGIDIPAGLSRIHTRMKKLEEARQHPGSSSEFAGKTAQGPYRMLVLTAETPSRMAAKSVGVARFLVRNVGEERWMAKQHNADPAIAIGIGVIFNGRLAQTVPLRDTVCPGALSPLSFEFRSPWRRGDHALQFCLMSLKSKTRGGTTIFHSTALTTERHDRSFGLRRQISRLLRRNRRVREPRFVADCPRTEAHEYDVEYLTHSFPNRPKAGVTYGVRLSLKNSGTAPWVVHPASKPPMQVRVSVDADLLAVLPLPKSQVHAGEQVTIHFPFRAHDVEGSHCVRIELGREGSATFTNEGIAPWEIDLYVVSAPQTESVRLFEIFRKHNPWHYNPLNGIPESREGHPLPLFISRARGCFVWDAEGNEFLDYTMGWGSTILGHADDRIQRAIRSALESGGVLPFPHPIEMEVSRALIEEFPSNDMVVFGKNGSDVCTIAARLARIVTKKRVILSCGFHGWQDFALDYFSFEDCGIPDRPDRCLHKFTFNDRAGFLELYHRYRGDLAAVMIEPAGPLINDVAGLGGEPDPEFLQTVADAARQANALLIFDEIITGFRYRNGSVQKDTGVIPDLTCLGKALASGMPLAALIGPYRIFLEHFHKTHFCPTFKSEVYSLAAAKAAIDIYRSEPVAKHIWEYGERLRQGIHQLSADIGIAGGCTGPPFRMAYVFQEADPERRQLKRTLLMQELLKQRIVTVTGMMLPSYAHNEDTLQKTLSAFGSALEVVAHAQRSNDLHSYIELTLL
ncbi:MAG: aminotransferase class III-fold pyridoxal phosphate-dependent enzyme [Bryobacteraceae bacterium]